MSNLLTLNTNLKSLKYGNDQLGGGTSRESSFLNKNITTENINEATAGKKYVDLGERLTDDVARLGFWFTTPEGLLFIAKQNALSKSVPLSEASSLSRNKYIENTYFPTNHLLQAGVGNSGAIIRFNKMGLEPFIEVSKYYDQRELVRDLSNNRIVNLHNELLKSNNNDNPIEEKWYNKLINDLLGNSNQIIWDERRSVYRRTNNEYNKGIPQTPTDEEGGVNTLPSHRIEVLESEIREQSDASYLDENNSPETQEKLLKINEQRTEYNKNHPYYSHIPNVVDKISTTGIRNSGELDKDLIKFQIKNINDNNKWIQFRAFLDPTMTDTYNSEWSSERFAGRAEEFFTYTGFTRSFSLGFTVIAKSQQELKFMYEKLNYLAGITAPKYSGVGFMTGNIIELTIGNYLIKQKGILRGITFNIDDNSTWDLDNELPIMIKVNNFSFSPIHNFAPALGERFIGPTNSVFESNLNQ